MRVESSAITDYSKYAALILAGGESTRMGKDKTRLEIGGKSLIWRMILNLMPITSHMVVMLNQSQETPSLPDIEPSKLIFGRDSIPKRGPLGAIADSIELFPGNTRYVYLTATDLPYVTTGWFLELRERMKPGTDVVHAVDNDITNPLLALYRLDVLKRAVELLARGETRPLSLWKNLKTIGITAPESQPHLLEDMNKPADYEMAKRRLEGS